MIMEAPLYLLPFAIAEMMAQASHSRQLTLADRYGLMAAVFDESLGDEERHSVNRLLRNVCKGRLQIVNEISALL